MGLGQLAKPDEYIGRQRRRWIRQYHDSATRDRRPLVARLHDALSSSRPPEAEAVVVHGDYRPDNCMVDPSGEAVALFDWELSAVRGC